MRANDIPLGELTEIDRAALEALDKRQDAMLARTISWSKINTVLFYKPQRALMRRPKSC